MINLGSKLEKDLLDMIPTGKEKAIDIEELVLDLVNLDLFEIAEYFERKHNVKFTNNRMYFPI